MGFNRYSPSPKLLEPLLIYMSRQYNKAGRTLQDEVKALGRNDRIITLVGVKQARPGFAFIHQGASSACSDCQYRRVCLDNLSVGRIYEVTKCREKILECKIHEAGVKAVEVVESEVPAVLPKKLAIEGVVITYNKQDCDAQDCPTFERCVSKGLLDGDRCQVVKVTEKVKCPMELSLVEVVLQRVQAS